MEHKDESYLDSLLENFSTSSDNLYNTMLNNDANSFQMDEKEIDDINFDDIEDDISFDLDDDFGLDELENIGDFEDFDEISHRMDNECNDLKSTTFEKMQEDEIEAVEPNELIESTESMDHNENLESMVVNESESLKEQVTQGDISMENLVSDGESIEMPDALDSSNEDISPFEDDLMESLLSEEPFLNDLDSDKMQEIKEQDEEDPLAGVEDLLGLLEAEEENPEALDNLDFFGASDSQDIQNDKEDVFSIHSLEEEPEEIDKQVEEDFFNDSMEELLDSKVKKVGFFKRLFGNIHDEKARKQNKPKGPVDENGNPIIKPKKTKQEIKAEKEAKKKDKNEIKKVKATKAAEIKAQKKDAKRNKAEMKKEKKMQVVVEEDEGRINRVGATIVFFFFGIMAACIILGTDNFSYTQSIKKATEYFGIQKYNNAYEEVSGIDVKEKDHEIYDKIMTVMFVNKQLNSYNNYYNMEMYPQALDSLLKGLQRYDEYISIAKELGIKSDLDYVRNQILGELNSIFELTEDDSYTIIHSDNQEMYSQKVIKAASID